MLKRKGKVLIVDDEPSILGAIRETIAEDYDVATATNGKEALEVLNTFMPDVILLDVAMPEMDGFETFDRIKKMGLGIKIPVMFLTARAQIMDIEKGLGKGAYDYMVKPFLPSRLLDKLHEIFRRLKTREEEKKDKKK